MFQKLFILIFILSFALTACRENLPEKSSENFPGAIRSFYVGLAALQVGDDQRARVELTKATEIAANEPAAWNNLGVLQLRQKDFEAAVKSLEKAGSLAPDNAKIFANLAVLETQRGNFDKAIENLNKTIELEPNNAQAIYALAQEKERQANDAEALTLYERIGQTKPENIAVKLEIARLAAKLNNAENLQKTVAEIGKTAANFPPEAKEQFAALQNSAANPKQAATQISFLRNVLLREPVFRAALAEIKASDTATGEVFTKPLKLPTPDFSPAEPDTALTFSAQTVENVKANFAKAIFLNGENPPVVAWSNEKETRVGKASLPVATTNANQICAFDFDYDFKNDLAFATEKGFRLFKQTDGENFQDVTANTKLPNEFLQKSYVGVWTFDAESDGDLDLILASKTGAPVVLQNNSDGSFKEIKIFAEVQNLRQFAWADLDEDGDGDAVTLDASGKIQFFSNERGGLFRQRNLPNLNEVSSITVGDANGDGKLDLIVLSGKIIRISDKNGGDWEVEEISDIVEKLFCGSGRADTNRGGLDVYVQCTMKVADFDNNGANDILISDESEAQIFYLNNQSKFSSLGYNTEAKISSFAETNGDGKLDLIGIDADGKPTVFQNQSAKNYHWQILRPRAAKTEGDQRVNSFGIGGEIEVRTGLQPQKQLIQSPQVHFGLGERDAADVLRVVWGNGYVQAEFDLKSDQQIAAEQRLKGSCPHLFAWNGERFALVKDAPPWSPALGLKINAQDTYGVLQTEEWFKIPGEALKAKDGFYELRITAEYWEAYYIDNYQLLAVDHADTTEVFTDERFSIPLPPLKVFTTEKTQSFASAKNDKDEDVSEVVKNLDEKYLDGFRRGTFQGVAEEHFVELELPENAPADKKIWIVADGWLHPTDASINVQLGQSSKEKPKSLSLEVQDSQGNWKIAKENLGFPAGKMKTILIDLPGGAKRFRLRTNMEVFWDKLAWGTDIAENQNVENRLQLSSAELRHRGFSVIEKADDSSPEKPVYDKILTTGERWRDLEGYYTRFGDVKELLAAVDDRFVLVNAGDEIILKFPALPEVGDGMKRDFVIIGNGWIKDGDLNSVFSKTLLPLPTHATNDYTRPPTRLEDDPVYQKNKSDWLNFHTRYVAPDLFRNALRNK
ncbi:MAG TPA: FG-GAP-like repeat-containing protein [Pyrinomonadaceae bacterium]|jgi:Tfp pilus assembly protein PilF